MELLERTRLSPVPLVPEIRVHVADELTPLWEATAETAPPYWAVPWVGGQALARHLVDRPELVRARRVLDVGTGSGVVALAAARSGARVLAVDVDPRALHAARANARANGLELDLAQQDPIGREVDAEVVLLGDLFYERPLAERLLAWARACARDGKLVLAGDPGRAYFPASGVERLARYEVPSVGSVEGRAVRAAGVFRVHS